MSECNFVNNRLFVFSKRSLRGAGRAGLIAWGMTSFMTLHPENKALNLLDSALTLFPKLRPELQGWVRQLIGTIARPVAPPPGLEALTASEDELDMNRETYLLARALCDYRERVYPGGQAAPTDPDGAAGDDLNAAMDRFEERLSRARPPVELEEAPDAGDYADNEASQQDVWPEGDTNR